jgi:hypothetical protein
MQFFLFPGILTILKTHPGSILIYSLQSVMPVLIIRRPKLPNNFIPPASPLNAAYLVKKLENAINNCNREKYMKDRILKMLYDSQTSKVPMSEIIHDLFDSIRQLESFGMIITHTSCSGSKIDDIEITKLGREYCKEKLLKK